MFTIEELKKIFEDEKETIIKDYLAYLRFPSIATDPHHRKDVEDCAAWLADYLRKSGFHVDIWRMNNHSPILFATELSAGPDKETILLYGHYDVQPVDPLEEWDAPPFEPALANGDVFARGAADNKGQSFYTITALRLLLKKLGRLPVNIKLLIEGEEESGSVALSQLVYEKSDAIKADHLLIVDSGIPNMNTPAITLGARGIACFSFTVQEADYDLHSGSHGGLSYNPNKALIQILSKLHGLEGRVTVPGFYDKVVPISEEEKSELAMDFDLHEFKKQFGYLPTGMEKGMTPLEANWLRPTLEINGISGGYAGAGFKTVIPAKAVAKISVRLVPDQDPDAIVNAVKQFLVQQVPPGFRYGFEVMEGHGRGFRSNPHSKTVKILSKAYENIFNKPCEKILIGGSIPISAELASASQADTVLIGVGLPTDRIHAPNERFSLDRLEIGFLIIAHAIELFAEE